jgi:hypothetical protein
MILVRDGRLVPHASVEISRPGQTAKACTGSDLPVRADSR